MDTARKICTVLSENDLLPENINTTIKTIEHNADKFYLLQSGWQTNLWEVVEQLGRVSEDENTLTKMRIAYNLKFDLPTTLKAGNSAGVKVKNFADLLEHLDFDENLNLTRADYHVIINDDTGAKDANRAVNELYQQSVFLWINGLDIRKKSDMRPIRIVVMGTKKAGKSVLIKNFIQGDYAPTNSTLPTPNTIVYIPADPKKQLTLDYGDRRFVFGDAADLKYFIGKEYARVQKDFDVIVPDMTIYYPCEVRGYEIWDMPGLNVITDESIQKTKKIIETVDVCIFVMNHNKVITTDEVKFLKNIRGAVD
ncbi:MAG: dynamin family protein, partial [Selenomonadaceae bacterium]|nr:dynamin family protein [Selenomonadaceae bacterium]